MKMKKIFLIGFIISFVINLNAQDYFYNSQFGDFNVPVSFTISPLGYIYVADTGDDIVYQFDTLGNQIRTIGGYGWESSQFDDPVYVFANPLNIFVCDKNNHKIQQFDKDLNFISELFTHNNQNQDEVFGYPLSTVTSSQGDLIILDSENDRILKFDIFGKFIQNFGGFDYGNYSLGNPINFTISADNKLYVLDDNEIKLFDVFGNGIDIITLKDTSQIEMNYKSIKIFFNKLTLTGKKKILFSDLLNNSQIQFQELNFIGDFEKVDFIDSLIYNDKIYILTNAGIYIFTKEKI
ncbi:MAG: hypothetical protein STSR0008_04010 [Ignavibacterium sp.]